MRPLAKVGLVGAGYVGALALAAAVVAAYLLATSGPDRQHESGMAAFGDALLFLAVFSVAATAPTGAALYFLRPHRAFWRALSTCALALAITAIAALVAYAAPQASDPGSMLNAWSAVAVLRILVAPSLALASLLAAAFAPVRGPRLGLLGAAAVETAVFACAVIILVGRMP
jgi:hypothetical protein